jgi:ribosomal protein L7Ae-like RNA K-turn-binding protein
MPKRGRAASTVSELGGVVSSKVAFIRTDARAACREAAPSQTRLKTALSSPFEPSWPHVSAPAVAALVKGITAECTARLEASHKRPGLFVGLRSVTRALRRGELRAIVAASELQPPLLLAQLAVLSEAHGAHLAVIPTLAAALGQPLGLLRAAVFGLSSAHFAPDHPLVTLVTAVPKAAPCWLPQSRKPAVRPAGVRQAAPSEPETATATAPGDGSLQYG